MTASPGPRPSAPSSRSPARQAALDGLAQTAPEALGQLQRGRRRRHRGDRPKRRTRGVGAQLLDVVEALAADQLRLGQRHHQLAARDAAAAAFDRRGTALGRQLAVDQLDQAAAARQLAHTDQPRERRQRVVVGAKDDPSGPLSPSTTVTASVTSTHTSWQASTPRHHPGPTGRKTPHSGVF